MTIRLPALLAAIALHAVSTAAVAQTKDPQDQVPEEKMDETLPESCRKTPDDIEKDARIVMDKADINKDGKITKIELRGTASQTRGASFINKDGWKDIDSNKDGKLTQDEIGGFLKTFYEKECAKVTSETQ